MERFRGLFNLSGNDRTEERPSPPPVSASTFAQLAQDVYRSDSAQGDIDGFRRVPAEELQRRGIAQENLHTSSGMHAEVYERSGQVVVSYRGTVNPSLRVDQVPYDGGTGLDPEIDFMNARRGTEPALRAENLWQSAQDWYTNARQGLGLETSQHNDAVALAKRVNDGFGADNVMFTGHSKGGGEAQLASALHGQTAVTFNAAAPHDETLRRFGLDPAVVREHAPSHIASVVTRGEAVDRLQGATISTGPALDAMVRSGVYGDVILPDELPSRRMGDDLTLRTPVTLGRRVEIEPDPALGSIARHLMADGVIPYLSQVRDLDTATMRGRSAPDDQAPSASILGRNASPFHSLYQPLGFQSPFAGLHLQQPREQEPAAPLLNDARHPHHRLFSELRQGVDASAPIGMRSDERDRLAGALTVESLRSGLTGVDSVRQRNGETFALQNGIGHAKVVTAEAVQVPLEQSSRTAATLVPEQAVQSPQRDTGCRVM